MKKFRIGDTVKVITGKDKGQIGKITKVLKKQNKITVDGINTKIKHVKPTQSDSTGQIIQIDAPIHVSNVMVCDADNIGGRVGFKLENNKKQRVNKRTNAII